MQRRTFLTSGLAAGVFGIPSFAQTGRINVVATIGMLSDTVSVLAPSNVRVEALMGAGVDPHSFRQTRSDVVKLSKADLVVKHGLYLEAQMVDLFERLSARVDVFSAGEQVPEAERLPYDEDSNQFDPHVWMDPQLWKYVARGIANKLTVLMPGAKDEISDRLALFNAQLDALSNYGTQVFSTLPAKSKVLVTAHDAFQYFGRAFDFEVQGVKGISTTSEAGLNRIERLVSFIVENDLKAIFVESSQSDRNMRALIEGASARGHTLSLGGTLFSDAMGTPGTYEGTYIGMMDHNITTIARALGADAPIRGLNGDLSI